MHNRPGNQVIRQWTTRIKHARPGRSFGFAHGPGGKDIFIHESVIAPNPDGTIPTLREGDRVVVDAEQTPKGWKATRVDKVDAGKEGSCGSAEGQS